MIGFHGVPLDCINQAALHHHVPATMIVSVMQIENGRNGTAIKNKNGTYDLGVMQINTSWLSTLKKFGISRSSLQHDACLNVDVGAWILAHSIAKSEGWRGVGNYHSATPKFNKIYSAKVKAKYDNTLAVIQGELS
jgi:soluble lytic murein transglycosylase-like protein